MARVSKKTSHLPNGTSGFVHISLLAYDYSGRPFLYLADFHPRAEDIDGSAVEVRRWEDGTIECIVPSNCQLFKKVALSGRVVDWVTFDGNRYRIVPREHRWMH